jgi:hypothetical protein
MSHHVIKLIELELLKEDKFSSKVFESFDAKTDDWTDLIDSLRNQSNPDIITAILQDISQGISKSSKTPDKKHIDVFQSHLLFLASDLKVPHTQVNAILNVLMAFSLRYKKSLLTKDLQLQLFRIVQDHDQIFLTIKLLLLAGISIDPTISKFLRKVADSNIESVLYFLAHSEPDKFCEHTDYLIWKDFLVDLGSKMKRYLENKETSTEVISRMLESRTFVLFMLALKKLEIVKVGLVQAIKSNVTFTPDMATAFYLYAATVSDCDIALPAISHPVSFLCIASLFLLMNKKAANVDYDYVVGLCMKVLEETDEDALPEVYKSDLRIALLAFFTSIDSSRFPDNEVKVMKKFLYLMRHFTADELLVRRFIEFLMETPDEIIDSTMSDILLEAGEAHLAEFHDAVLLCIVTLFMTKGIKNERCSAFLTSIRFRLKSEDIKNRVEDVDSREMLIKIVG